jgi:DNA-binding beta-propeller fold protein YncE
MEVSRVALFLTLVTVFCAPTVIAQAPQQTTSAPASVTTPALQSAAPVWPGRRPDGSILLPNQWSLHPAGRQVELGDFPVNIAVHPGSRFAAVLHAGYSTNEVIVVRIPEGDITSRAVLDEAFYGLEFSADGSRLFASGASSEVVHEFSFNDGKLSAHRQIQLRPRADRGVPAGLAVDRQSRRLFVANVLGHRVTRVDLLPRLSVMDIPLGAGPPPSAEAPLLNTNPEETFPYACRLDEKCQRLYVSLWAQAAVAVIDLKSSLVVARWPTEEHPCEMVLTRRGKFLYVANANRNTVTVFDTEKGRAVETIWAALYPQSLPGSTPNSLALSPGEDLLFVANADNNIVAVFDVSAPGKSRSLGFLPAGWYPTCVRVTPDGRYLLVANGKGILPRANPHGPQPGVLSERNPTVEYIARLMRGTLGIVELPGRRKFEEQLVAYTAQAYHCTPLVASAAASASRPPDNPIPLKPGDPTPIRYCIYIIKENRTYDQVFGDLPQGNGAPNLCLFPERVTPNHHKLARGFVLLDNFYAEAEVSAGGHEWSTAAYATDFVEKTWPLNYGHGQDGKFPFPSEGNFPIAMSAGGYLWDRAREAGVSYRSYGEFVQNGRMPNDPATTRVKALQGHFDPWYRSFDLNYPDMLRAQRFNLELARFEAEGDMPRLQILRLPNDHTQGGVPGARTPTAFVGDNDMALGMVVQAVSHSKFWPQAAIFVVEDDAQNGPDHVDAHRTVAFVISPFARRGVVDSTMYSTASMLRTMELILGLRPMSQFDASAAPMFNSFQAWPDLRSYQASIANVNLEERNTAFGWGANLKMDFAKEDAVDDLLLSEVVWRSVRGADSPMPAPTRAGFIFAHPKEEGGD